MQQNLLFPVLMGAFVLLMVGRRVLRNIGRQPVRPVYMRFRIGLLSLIGALFVFGAVRDVTLIGALLGGVAAGAALGWFGLRHTRFEKTDEGAFYTPHTWIGAAVSLLLIARLAYRFAVVYPGMQGDPNAFAAMRSSPTTLAIFGVLIGYYVCYYVGVLRTSALQAQSA